MPKYKVFTNNTNLVKVGSTYAGLPVYGIAKCAPQDTFDYDYGYKLAKARCDAKIANLRLMRAEKKMNMYYELMKKLDDAYKDACDYFENSYQAARDAEREYYHILMPNG